MPESLRRPAPEALHLPPDVRYDCIQCGRGCMDAWEIEVDADSEKWLEQFDLKAAQQRAKDKDPIVDGALGDGTRSLCREGGKCTFLNEENRCALHALHGATNKPQTCIDFPWRFTETPLGVYAGLSFACTAVLRNEGRPAAAQNEGVSANYRQSLHVRTLQARPILKGRVTIDAEAYAMLEEAMLDLMAYDTLPIAQRLLAQALLLDLIARVFEAARLGHGDTKAFTPQQLAHARALPDGDLLESQLVFLRADRWARLFLMAGKQKADGRLERAAIGLVSAFRQELAPGMSRARAMAGLLRHYLGNAFALGSVRLHPLPRAVAHRTLRDDLHGPEVGSPADKLLTRYFRHTLFRKDLLAAESIHSAHRFQLLHYALFRWFHAALPHQPDPPADDARRAEEALRLVEQYYVLHSTFTRFLQKQPVLGTLVDSMIHTPRFAGAMTVTKRR